MVADLLKVGYRGHMANVLFLCPHGAGKSVVAATYFQASAARISVDPSASMQALHELAETLARTIHRAATEPDSQTETAVSSS